MSSVATASDRPPSAGQSAAIRPEVLAPAGDWDCLRAAIENGADAVYFGLHDFNARARAANFAVDELDDVIGLLHRRGVRGYVTLNTLVFPSELAAIEHLLRRVAASGADGAIVQDLGLVRLARALSPDLPLHASTQMTLTSAESIRLAEELGVERVVAARELSLDELRRIRRQTRMPLEVFVHGALCVAYSGQCLTSEALGGRSANRGQCAQACRLPYEVVSDGRAVDLADRPYVLSPQDLAAYALVPELVELGVAGLKIEGRLKTAEYVANITRHYRQAVDSALAGRPVEFSRRDVQEMEMSFSRGFSPGWLPGNNHKRLVAGACPRKRGIFLGSVRAVRDQRVLVQLSAPLKAGDGVVFDRGRPEEPEEGGRVYELFRRGRRLAGEVSTGLVELAFGRGDLRLALVEPGQRLWKTDDPALSRRLRQSYATGKPRRRLPLDIRVTARTGEPLCVECRAAHGAATLVASPEPLAAATRHVADEEFFRAQLGRLGGTAYELRTLSADIDGRPMVPLSVLGRLRHELVAALDAALAATPRRAISDAAVLPALRSALLAPAERTAIATESAPVLHVLCRNLDQVHGALECGSRSLYVDFQDIRHYATAVGLARSAGATIYLATPRIQKPAEGPLFRYLLRPEADGILVRNLGALLYFADRGVPIVADFSLNVANDLTVQLLRERGAGRVTASYDLNREQLADLVAAVPPSWLEVTIHQHMPMFHMEHCVFCAVLSPGTNRTNCGRPCDRHDVKLRDRTGMEHPLKADVGCRNTLHNAVPQSAAEEVPRLLAAGVRHFRVELLDHAAAAVRPILDLYGELLAGRVTGRTVWQRLQARDHVGVTRGPLEN
jgi:putative protease